MARIPFILLAFSSAWCSAFALDLRGRIQWNDVCSSYRDLGYAKVLLDDGRTFGSITKDGGFVIPDVTEGTYILSVLAHDHTFDPLRIDVTSSETVPEVRPYVPGTPLNPPSSISLPYPPVLSARTKHAYFVPREGFNLVGMFQNPMMLMMVFAGVMMMAMPYIMKKMDPEMLDEFKERQAKVANIQSSMASGDIKSGLSALLNADDDTKNAVSSGAKASSGSSPAHNRKSGGKNRKR